MNPIGSQPNEETGRCPDSDVVDQVLDREAPEETAVAVRRHIAGCSDCLELYGELFEVDSLAPAIARDGVEVPRTLAWPRTLLAAASLVTAATLVVLLRSRTPNSPEISQVVGPPASPTAAPPRLVASRTSETEIVVDGAGVHASILGGGSAPGSFEFESSRGGLMSCGWSPTSSAEESR